MSMSAWITAIENLFRKIFRSKASEYALCGSNVGIQSMMKGLTIAYLLVSLFSGALRAQLTVSAALCENKANPLGVDVRSVLSILAYFWHPIPPKWNSITYKLEDNSTHEHF